MLEMKLSLFAAPLDGDEDGTVAFLHEDMPVLHIVLDMLWTHELLALRSVSKPALSCVQRCTLTAQQVEGLILSSAQAARLWHKCFPFARHAVLKAALDWSENDFALFAGVSSLKLEYNYKFPAGFPVTDVALQNLATVGTVTSVQQPRPQRLEELKLSRCININGEGFQYLVGLKKLALHAMGRVDDRAFMPLGDCLEELRVDSLERGAQDRKMTLPLTFGCCSYLRALKSLTWHNASPVMGAALQSCALKLQHLDVCYADISSLRCAHLPALNTLSLNKCTGLQPAVFEGSHARLAYLRLEEMHDVSVEHVFKHLGHVTRMEVVKCSGIRQAALGEQDRGMQPAQRGGEARSDYSSGWAALRSLSHLTVCGCPEFDDPTLLAIPKGTLSALVLQYCPHLTDRGFRGCERSLRCLSFSECPGISVACLSSLTCLRTLRVSVKMDLTWDEDMDKASEHESIRPERIAGVITGHPCLQHVWVGAAANSVPKASVRKGSGGRRVAWKPSQGAALASTSSSAAAAASLAAGPPPVPNAPCWGGNRRPYGSTIAQASGLGYTAATFMSQVRDTLRGMGYTMLEGPPQLQGQTNGPSEISLEEEAELPFSMQQARLRAAGGVVAPGTLLRVQTLLMPDQGQGLMQQQGVLTTVEVEQGLALHLERAE